MNKIVNVNNVSFKYDKEYIFKNVSFTVEKGDFIGIIGSNGAGKSTLIKLILGQLKPSTGNIRVNGNNPCTRKGLEKIGYVPQVGFSRGAEFPATVTEIVMMNMYKEIGFFKFAKKKHLDKVYKALEIVNMLEFKNRKFSDLSGGQQQRVIIAKAIVNSPNLLILDEPTTGIDHKSETMLYNLLDKISREKNITIMMISHDLEKIKKHSSKLINLESFCDEEEV